MSAYPIEKIKNIANLLSVDIIEIKEDIDITAVLPKQSSVYIITTSTGRYIGSTQNVNKRISGHKLRKYIQTFDIYLTDTEMNAIRLENELIYKLNPELNLYCKSKNIASHIVTIYDYVSTALKKKQSEIRINYGINRSLSDIASAAINRGMENVEEEIERLKSCSKL